MANIIERIDCHDGKNYVCIYEFPLDGGKPNCCYRGRTSNNAFFSYKKTRFIDKERGLRYSRIDSVSWEIHRNGKYHIWKDLPVIKVKDIYEFFEAIGYSYKKGRYIHEKR